MPGHMMYKTCIVKSPNGDCVLVGGQETELYDVANTLSVQSGLPPMTGELADILLDCLYAQWARGYVEIPVAYRLGERGVRDGEWQLF